MKKLAMLAATAIVTIGTMTGGVMAMPVEAAVGGCGIGYESSYTDNSSKSSKENSNKISKSSKKSSKKDSAGGYGLVADDYAISSYDYDDYDDDEYYYYDDYEYDNECYNYGRNYYYEDGEHYYYYDGNLKSW